MSKRIEIEHERIEYALELAMRIGSGTGEAADVTIARAKMMRDLIDGWAGELLKKAQDDEDAFREKVKAAVIDKQRHGY